jgi:hypothetical protein
MRTKVLTQLPGFPSAPFQRLSLTSDNISGYTTAIGQIQGDEFHPAPLPFFTVMIMREPNQVFHRSKLHFELACAQGYKRTETHGQTETPFLVQSRGRTMEILLVHIDWSKSNTRIIQVIKQWVQANRPSNIKPKEIRGSTTPREMLRYLSAHRLLAVMSAAKASNLTEHHFGQPLYYTDSDWYKARNKSQSIMRELFEPFFRFDEQDRIVPRPWNIVIG